MEITLAKKAGFCFGVKRAINLALEGSKEYGKVCCLGPLIHNPPEVARLSSLGVDWVSDIDDLVFGPVVIRSHGVEPKIVVKLHDLNYEIIDATCPFVKRAQGIGAGMQAGGYQVVIVGDKNHPEVIGILGYLNESAMVFATPEEAQQAELSNKVGVIAQTTQTVDNFNSIVKVIESKCSEVLVHNTICLATINRQNEVGDLSKEMDVILVIGGKNSANTRKLAAISESNGTSTYIIENVDELSQINFANAEKVGITAGASTPDWIIEEVVNKMTEEKEVVAVSVNKMENACEESISNAEPCACACEETCEEQIESMADSLAAFEKDYKEIRRGQRISGSIVQISDSGLMIDIGGKSEGFVPRSELSPSEVDNYKDLYSIGQEIQVIVIRRENEEGHPLLSKKRVDADLSWDKLIAAFESKEVLSGKVLDAVKGGLLVDVGMRGFIPASMVELGFVSDLSAYKGKEISFKVVECDKNHNKLILSRKVVLEEEKQKSCAELWSGIQEGQTAHGVVQRLTNFGAFIDLGGVDGLLHVSEMAWFRVNHPSEIINIGDEVDVFILGVDKQNKKISLGLKQLVRNPWETVAEKYSEGSIVEAKVVRTAAFGAFAQLELGVEGLIHISQLSYDKVNKTEDVVKPGDVVKVKVLSYDLEAKRISLSIKETLDTPVMAEEEVPTHTEELEVTIGDAVGEVTNEEN